MAKIWPDSENFVRTSGERRVFRLFKNLPDHFYVWYEPLIIKHRPDFVILSKENGLLVIEVKDWKFNQLVECNPKEIEICFQGGKRFINPAEKTRKILFEVINFLEKNKDLTFSEGRFKGHLKFPCVYALFFTEIGRKEFEKIAQCFERDKVFLKEDILEFQNNPRQLVIRLKKLISTFGSWAEIDDNNIFEIRKLLFPEIRIPNLIDEGVEFPLDEIQETYAKNMVEGNVLLGGVAGSGKSLILIFRTKYLAAKFSNWKILLTCFNRTWVRGLNYLLKSISFKEKFNNVEIKNFHQLALDLAGKRLHQIDLEEEEGGGDKFGEEFLRYLEEHPEKQGIYDAILVDEGQDFKDIWIKSLVKLLNPKTNSFLIVYDNAQRIYRRKGSWLKDTSLYVRGARHSLFLGYNYRNSREIFLLAKSLFSNRADSSKDKYSNLLIKQYKRFQMHGPLPEVFIGFQRERIDFILERVKFHIESGILPQEIAILFLRYQDIPYTAIMDCLKKMNISSKYTGEDKTIDQNMIMDKRHFDIRDKSVKIISLHSFKGYEAKVIFLWGLENLSSLSDTEEEAKAKLYVGITRAKEFLYLLSESENYLIKELKNNIEKIAVGEIS